MKATVFDIQRGSFVDGPGIRTAVFFKGCNLDCKWCHNPESKSSKTQLAFYKERCKNCGLCKSVCPNRLESCVECGECAKYCPNEARVLYGKDYTKEQLLDEIKRDKNFYDISNGGVTFTGGECMLQVDFLKEVCLACKENGIHTAIDTAGNVPYEDFEKVMPYTDLFLYDVKCVTDELHVKGTGVSNVRIIENFKRLAKEFKGEIIVRVPVIGGFNDSLAEMQKIAELVRENDIKKVELLNYNSLGEVKSKALNKEPYKFYPSKKINEYEKLFN